MVFVLLLILQERTTGGHGLLEALPRIKSRQTSPTGDERQNKWKSGPCPADSLNESQLAAGRDLLCGAGRHRHLKSKQQASLRQRRRASFLRSRAHVVPM